MQLRNRHLFYSPKCCHCFQPNDQQHRASLPLLNRADAAVVSANGPAERKICCPRISHKTYVMGVGVVRVFLC